jgi:hypothetical protein
MAVISTIILISTTPITVATTTAHPKEASKGGQHARWRYSIGSGGQRDIWNDGSIGESMVTGGPQGRNGEGGHGRGTENSGSEWGSFPVQRTGVFRTSGARRARYARDKSQSKL